MSCDAPPTDIDALHAIIAAQTDALAAAKAGLVAKTLELEKLPRDNQAESGATIWMRKRRRCRHGRRA